MKTIYKFPIEIVSKQTLALPANAIFRFLDRDANGMLCLWYEVETYSDPEPIEIYVLGTGHRIPEGNPVYLGSHVSGEFVWHVYTK
jgi:hypothetical protein